MFDMARGHKRGTKNPRQDEARLGVDHRVMMFFVDETGHEAHIS